MSIECYQPTGYTHVDETWSQHHQPTLPGPIQNVINRFERGGKEIVTDDVAAAKYLKNELLKHLPSGSPGKNPFTRSVERFVHADLNLLEDFIVDLIKIGLSNVEGLIRSILCTFGVSLPWQKFRLYIGCPFPYAAAGMLCGTVATAMSGY